jgi:hypothetical protein
MHVNKCHIVSTLSADNPEGFSSMVSKQLSTADADPKQPATVTDVIRGPFATIQSAIDYARSWNDAANPPAMPVVTTTVSESQFIQVPIPNENPPLVEPSTEVTTDATTALAR